MAKDSWYQRMKMQIIRAKEMWVMFTNSMPKFYKDFIPFIAAWLAPMAAFLEFAELYVLIKDQELNKKERELIKENLAKAQSENETQRLQAELRKINKKIAHADEDIFFQYVRTILRTTAVTLLMVVGFAIVGVPVTIAAQAFGIIATSWSAIDYCYKGYRTFRLEKTHPKHHDWDRLTYKGIMLFGTATGLALLFFCPPLAVVGWTLACSTSSMILARGMYAHNKIGKTLAGLTTTSVVISVLLMVGVLAIPGLNVVAATALVMGLSIAGMMYVMTTKSDKHKKDAAFEKSASIENIAKPSDIIVLGNSAECVSNHYCKLEKSPMSYLRDLAKDKSDSFFKKNNQNETSTKFSSKGFFNYRKPIKF